MIAKATIILLFVFISVQKLAQMEGYNIIYVDEDPFLILNSQQSESCISNKDIRGRYLLEDGVLYFDSIISQEKGAVYTCATTGGKSRIDYTGNLILSKILKNEKQVLKYLANGRVTIDYLRSELSMISLKNGEKLDQYCVGESHKYCSNTYGGLLIDIYGDFFSIELYREGKLITFLTPDSYDYFDQTYILPTGKYDVEVIYAEDTVWFNSVQVVEDVYRAIYLDGHTYDIKGDYEGTSLPKDFIFALDLLYSSKNILADPKNEVNQDYHVGLNGGSEVLSNKLSTSKLIGTYGVNMDYYSLDREYDSLNSHSVKRMNYFGIYCSTDVILRQYVGLNDYNKPAHFFIDLGISYRMPLYFRKNVVMDQFRFSEKWLHKFNEFVVYSRIGLTNGAALTFSYRPFKSIKNGLPQLSKFQFGVTFMIGA